MNGNANVPTKFEGNKTLGRWVSTQRSQYKLWKANKRSHMTQERYDKLLELGFQFDMLSASTRSDGDADEPLDSPDDSSIPNKRTSV